jgi:putative DNA-invertase from lambdoid prophage Rac
MAHVAYFRCSTADQSIEAQRHVLLTHAAGAGFDKEFSDHGVSGATPAAARPGFAALLAYVREGDVLHVYAVDRLGRDAIDVQTTVRALLARGVEVDVHGLGRIARGVGELILAVLAQVADMERNRIQERTAAGREKAIATLRAEGRTHRGKASMGRPMGRVAGDRTVSPAEVVAWRKQHQASIAATARQWGLSEATVKRYSRSSAARAGGEQAPN